MAWTQKQLAEARKLFKRPGNRLTWAECVKRATKGGGTKKRAKVGAKKPAKRTTVVKSRKTVVRKPVNIRIGGIAGNATSDLVAVQRKIQSEEAAIDKMRGRSLAGMGASDKKAHRTEIAKRKQYVSQLKKHKTALKRFV